jgi:hypothetical protein
MTRLIAALLLATALGLWVAPARGAEVHEFHDALAEAYRHYREGAFYLATGNPDVAAFELATFADKWAALAARYGDKPPGIYAKDEEWRTTLEEISRRTAEGLNAAEAGEVEAAREHLVPVRAVLGRLRQRNGVFIYSDCVDRANAAMDRLYHFRRNPPDFTKPDEIDELRRAAALTAYWYEQCRESAPPEALADPQFERLMGDSLRALTRIWTAIRAEDPRAVVGILRELRSWDRFLFLRFG